MFLRVSVFVLFLFLFLITALLGYGFYQARISFFEAYDTPRQYVVGAADADLLGALVPPHEQVMLGNGRLSCSVCRMHRENDGRDFKTGRKQKYFA